MFSYNFRKVFSQFENEARKLNVIFNEKKTSHKESDEFDNEYIYYETGIFIWISKVL